MTFSAAKLTAVALAAALLGCGGGASVGGPRTVPDALAAKAALYADLRGPGPLAADTCDSLLWTALANEDVQPYEAAHGRWLRRPVSEPECYAAGESGSTVSRDMVLGVLWWAWRNQDAGVTERLWAYARTHGWRLGEGDLARTAVTPALARLTVDVHRALTGAWLPGSGWTQAVPTAEVAGLTGYQAHLQWLRVALRAEVDGELSDNAREVLEAHAKRQPRNPMPRAVLGRWGDAVARAQAVAQLLGDPVWPADRLPTTADRCDVWVVQRDDGPDWAPCGSDHPAETFTGADLEFVVRLLTGGGGGH